MMSKNLDLFDDQQAPTSTTPEPIPMVDADVRFVQGFYRQPLSMQYMNSLLDEIQWREEKIRLWGKEYLQPRLSAWYGNDGSRYAYSGIVLDPHPWTALLLRIKQDIEHASGHRFNSVLLNLYRNEADSVGWHSDSEAELGETPVIASLSLGETRTFKLRHKTRKDLKPVAIELTDGSLLLMGGATQNCWQHAVNKQRDRCGQRINLTFRNIVN
jgi:alkylated DNA repair dioxygenase AlkB